MAYVSRMADETELLSNIKSFVKTHRRLINAEYEEEKKEFIYENGKPEIGNLEKNGVLINDLMITSVESEFGSCIVEFSRTSVSKQSCPLMISSGDIASIWFHNEDDDNRKTFLASGTIMEVADIIKISFDNSNPFNWDHELKYFIVKTVSEVTFRRMKNALENMVNYRNGRCSVIMKHLFGLKQLEKSALNPKLLDGNGELKWCNGTLHSSQKNAVKFCLEQNNFAIVHGPPGTGKTTVLIEIILQLVNTGHKILVCAPSNIAVDTIVERLSVIKPKIIRVGKTARMLESSKTISLGAAIASSDEASILKDVRDELVQHQRELRRGETRSGAIPYLRHEIKELKREYYLRQYRTLLELLGNASVVLTTLSSASEDGDLKNLPQDFFDVVIIDECSQAIEAACWIVIPRAPKLILAGDHLQLPPTIKSKEANDGGLRLSLMERAIQNLGEQCFMLLTLQFRMNSSIMHWVSSFYKNRLVADDSVAKRLLKDLAGVMETDETDTSLMLVDTAGLDHSEQSFHESKCNKCEADIVAILVKRLTEAGVSEDHISVITPYSLQVSCIKMKINNYPGIEVRTVDGFQGREKEAVIISFVRSNKTHELGFVSDKRRLNVAVSRAKNFLAIVGDSSTLGKDRTIDSLWKHIVKNGVSLRAHDFQDDIEQLDLPDFTPSRPEVPKGNSNIVSKSKKTKKEIWPSEKRECTSGSPHDVIKEKYQTCADIKDLQNSFKSLHIASPKGVKSKRRDVLQKPFTFRVESSDSDNNENSLSASDMNISVEEKETNPKPKQTKIKNKMFLQMLKCDDSNDSENTDEDFKAIRESQSRNTTCFIKACQTNIKLYPHLCKHCNEIFCVNHLLPEIHGCGDAARRHAKQNFKHKPPKVDENDKRKACINLKKRVAQFSADRKRQSKK